MKKFVLFVLCAMLSAVVMTGCEEESPFVQKEYVASASEVSEININVRDRKIEVTSSDDDDIRIVYSENDAYAYDIAVSDDGTLTMTCKNDKDIADYFGLKPSDADLTVSLCVPDGMVERLTLCTTNEDITLEPLSVSESADIETNGGNIEFESLDVGSGISLTAKNGDIDGTIVGGWDDFSMDVDIKKGECNLPTEKTGGEKTLSVSENNGDVNIEFVG